MSITKKSKIYSTCLFIFFVIVAIITLLPLALLAVSSLRPGSDLMRYGLNFSIDWANANLNEYKMLFSGANALSPVGGIGVDTPDKAYELDDYTVTRLGRDILIEREVVRAQSYSCVLTVKALRECFKRTFEVCH